MKTGRVRRLNNFSECQGQMMKLARTGPGVTGRRKPVWRPSCLLILVCLSACNVVTDPDNDDTLVGSGSIVTEQRTVTGFDRISLEGVGRVIIDQTGSESLTITTDDNLIPHLTSEVRNGQLIIGVTGNTSLDPTDDIVFRLTVNSLDEIDVSGVGTIDVTGLASSSLRTIITGVATMTVGGTTDTQHITITGVATYLAENLQSRVATLDGTGVLTVVVRATERLDGNVCGVGSIEYFGNPAVSLVTCQTVTLTHRTN